MRSTFAGLETAKRGMYTQQSAIYVTGHNIANVNTPGYSRQRVNFESTEPYPAASMNRPQIPGQLGTGVKAGTIQRMRESFIDEQYRNENNEFGYYETKASLISKMEDVMNEPSDFGLAKAVTQFWQSLQDLSTNPENEGARRVVIQRGTSVAETFRYLHSSLTTLRNDVKKELDAAVDEINSLVQQITAINKQVSEIEPHGYLPNDLYDERDRLLDELSKLVPIETEVVKYGGNSLDIAEGGRKVTIKTADGDWPLIHGNNEAQLLKDGDIITLEEGKGKLAALISAYGKDDPPEGLYPEMLDNLDKYAYTFTHVFNAIHEEGLDLKGVKGTAFFDAGSSYTGAAGAMKVIISEPSKIAAASAGTASGNGGNAINLGNMKDTPILDGEITLPFTDGHGSSMTLSGLEITSGTLQSFYEGVIGEMAVKGQQANRLEYNTSVLLNSVDKNRKSISEVSLDEEFSNLIQFQHAYSASARMITAIDEMLDKIINGMGHVGR